MVKRIRFRDAGFRGILKSPGVTSVVAAEARSQAQRMESETGVPYELEQKNSASRCRFVAKPEEAERVPDMDHETWMNEVWPRVGGPSWRPRRN